MDNVKSLMQVTQLPVITEQLKVFKEELSQMIADSLCLDCNEDNLKIVKKNKAEINKVYKDLEARRIEVKNLVLAPYNEFEVVYKECVKEVIEPGIKLLGERVTEVEDRIKDKKEFEIVEYFNEYKASLGIDFVMYEDLGIKVTMTASPKSLKEKVSAYLDNVAKDLAMIATLDHSAEVLVEYKRCRNASEAVATVNNRLKAIEAERQRAEQQAQVEQVKAETVERVDDVLYENMSAPVVMPSVEPENDAESFETPVEVKKYALGFKVITPKIEHLKTIKQLMESLRKEGLSYEQIKY